MKQKHKIQLTTLTPVCIGTGSKLSPYADYVIDEQHKKIYYVNQELVKSRLEENMKLIDEYVAGVTSGMDNNRSLFRLENFLKNRLKIDIRKEHRLQMDCEAKGSKELYTIVKNGGLQPYIPGSSLKGAIKTALLYDWLTNNAEGKKIIEELLRSPKGEKGNKAIEKMLNQFNPGLSDTSLIEVNQMRCIDTKRLHIKKGNMVIPQAWESIVKNTLSTLTYSERQYEQFKPLTWAECCRVINQYSKAGNQCEWDILSDIAGDKMRDDIYDKLYDFHEAMNNDINEADEHTAFLKLGSGKGYYLNSVGLAMFNADKSENKTAFLRFLKQVGFGKVFKKETRRMEDYDLDPYDFPITRVIDVNKLQPIGWIKLKLEK